MRQSNGRSMSLAARLVPAACLAVLPAAQAAAADGQGVKGRPDAVWAIDSDGDRVPDLVEAFYRTSAFDPAERPQADLRDTDGDGVPDVVERSKGTSPADPGRFPVPELPDTDGDATPDIHEIVAGRDPLTADRPQPDVAPGFVTTACRPGFMAARASSNRLCIDTLPRSAANHFTAASNCQQAESRMCTYEDLFYRYRFGTGIVSHNPFGVWLGNRAGDDAALCGSATINFDGDPDINNFEGTCNKGNFRQFWCCHDVDPF